MNRLFGRSRRLVLGASLLLAGLLAVTVAPGGAHAQWGTCYDDPAVYLDNGTTVYLGAAYFGDSTVVTAVNYTLHIPVGVSVTGVTYFGPNQNVETLNWAADNTAYTYDSDTQVIAPNASLGTVTAMAVVAKHTSVSTAMGQANQDVLNHLVAK
ncbi:MAG: hypothetical protein M3Z66_14125 [Chloroflexota bacterium]|nr:hypothetical protein [Chloroflexota bacterium]